MSEGPAGGGTPGDGSRPEDGPRPDDHPRPDVRPPEDDGSRSEDDPFAFAPDERDRQAAVEGGGESAGLPGSDGREEPGRTDGSGRTVEASRADEAGGADQARRADEARRADQARRADETRRAELQAEADEARRAARATSTRWVLVGGLLVVVLAGGSTLLAGRGSEDAAQVRPGERLPAFAAPIATRPRVQNDDVNLAERDGQGAAGSRAACSVRLSSAVTSCALLRRGPVVLVVYSRGLDACLRTVDEVDRATRALPGLTALAVETRGEHDATARTVRARDWRLTTVYDADGALSSRLGAAVCPLVLFVRRDGTVADRLVGDAATGAEIRARAGRLLRSGAPADSPAQPATGR